VITPVIEFVPLPEDEDLELIIPNTKSRKTKAEYHCLKNVRKFNLVAMITHWSLAIHIQIRTHEANQFAC